MVAYLSWGLSLNDLKQLCMNSIEYASIEEDRKHELREFFNYKWKVFLAFVRGKY